MKILYHIPHINVVNAQRTIYNGFKNALIDLGYEFYPYTSEDNLELLLDQVQPDIFMTQTHFYYQKDLDFKVLQKYRDTGMKVFAKIDFWNSPIHKSRINEAKSMKDDHFTVKLIKDGLYADYFYHVVEQSDKRMEGFKENTGYDYHTIPLAADKITLQDNVQEHFRSDISFIGTYLAQKRDFFDEYVFPLKNKYDLKLYGQEWTQLDRVLGFTQKVGQYFNIPIVKSIRKPKLKLEDEGHIYASSTISINVHEDYQREFGGDCNERTFKIPFCNGFEITDNVACIHKYFKVGEEIIVAENKQDWFDKIDYYIKNPDKRLEIIAKGKARVEKNHTYHNRVEQIIEIYNKL
jgi:glycosyltransferase involved in cell wall biosynthesis